MKNFTRYFIGLILFFNSFAYADYATTKRITVSDLIQGSVTQENYIKDSPPKAGVTKGWSCYADAAGSVPVDGTGGSPTGVTWTATSTTPLKGPGAFVFTKSGSANKQGMGCSYNFTIDKQDKAKVLGIEAEYLVDSGTFTAGTSSTNSDIIWYIYDVTNAKLIEPSSIKLLSNSTTLTDAFKATFQTSSDSVSYRLIAHVSTTTTNDFALKFGGISISRSSYPTGTPISDWQSYTLTIGSTGTVPTKGTVSIDAARYRRIGDSLEIRYQYKQTSAGASGTGNYLFPIPSGFSIDTSKVTASTSDNTVPAVGHLSVQATTEGLGVGAIQAYDSTRLWAYAITSANSFQVGATNFNLGQASVLYSFTAIVPILGWSSSVQMSDSADTRILAAKYTLAVSTSITSGSPINFATKVEDTHGAVTTGASWKFTAPISGLYSVTALQNANGAHYYRVYKNGVADDYLSGAPSANYMISGKAQIRLNAGEYIDVRPDASVITQSVTYITIERISGPSAIAATETVAASYNIPNHTASTTITIGSKISDTHGMVSGNNITIPISGFYMFSVYRTIAAAVANNITILVDGASQGIIVTNNLGQAMTGTKMIYCNAGQVVTLSNTGTSTNLTDGRIDWFRVK